MSESTKGQGYLFQSYLKKGGFITERKCDISINSYYFIVQVGDRRT